MLARPDRNPRHGRRRRLRLVAALATVLTGTGLLNMVPTGTAGADTVPPKRIVTGWLPYWSSQASVDDLVANKDLFTESSPFWFYASSATTISEHVSAASRSALTDQIHAVGIGVWPTVTDGLPAHGMAAVLANGTTRTQHVAALVNLVVSNGYEGVDLDYEKFAFSDGSSTWATTRPSWVAFVAQLSAALHAHGRKLAVSVPYMTAPTTGYWVYDYAGIGPYVDRLRIMTYDYSTSHAGPIAPISWVRAVAAFAVTQLTPSKVEIGIPAYGYDWPSITTGCPVDNVPARQSLTSQQALALASSLGIAPAWDATNQERTFSYPKTYKGLSANGTPASCTVTRRVWFEEASAAVYRTRLVPEFGLGGVAFWTIGGEDPRQWPAIRAFALSITPRTTTLTAHALTPHVVYGETATVQGILRTTAGVPVAGVPVQFQGALDGGGHWSNLGIYTTSTAGVVNATHVPTARTSYRFVFATTGNALASTSPVAVVTVEAVPAGLVYTVPGYHSTGTRQWYTTCEPYGTTATRCTASIWATMVYATSSGYVARLGWVVNNLTYLGVAGPGWDANPLARTGTFVSGGHQWRVTCVPNVTSGPRSCTAYILSNVVARVLTSSGYRYVTITKWVFNDIVLLR